MLEPPDRPEGGQDSRDAEHEGADAEAHHGALRTGERRPEIRERHGAERRLKAVESSANPRLLNAALATKSRARKNHNGPPTKQKKAIRSAVAPLALKRS